MRGKVAAAAALVVAAFVVSWYGFFFFRDNFTTHYPMKVLSAQAFRAAEIPWWNFHDMGGQPLAGNPNSLTFYPDNVLYLFLPPHVAFNLHFLLHLGAGFLLMRRLSFARTSDRFAANVAATVWLLSGVVISATAFYNLVTAVALVPLAFLAAEKRSGRLLGLAFGLMLLGCEPMTTAGTALAVAIVAAGRFSWRSAAAALILTIAIASPQLVAYSEIASEVERSVPMSVNGVLATSLTIRRVAEIFFWPLHGFLNDAGGLRQRLFSTIFLGVLALPALVTRSRYVAAAGACLFFALGSGNPLVRAGVAALPESLRIVRFPEKLVMPMTAALVVLIAGYLARTRFARVWAVVAIVPLLWTTARALPIDWFDPYRVSQQPPVRIHWNPTIPVGQVPARAEYHMRAAALDWMFGAVGDLRYAIGRSPDNMHSLLSRAVAERFSAVPRPLQERYLRVQGCNVPGGLPLAMVVPETIPARNLGEAVRELESPRFDERRFAVAPLAAFRSAAGRVVSYREDGQTLRIGVEASGPLLLMVNQSFFEAWSARTGQLELDTLPLNIDRLGVMVPGGRHEVTLTFGRLRGAVVACWILSSLLIFGSVFPRVVQKLDRRPREVERPADEHGR
ncbi:MAG TPA: hypothetical protein VFT12_12815 [Thermoanaerobaculia bacterium]|nr:hypothetical protein [Thermoanaerobaculia bacterium]